jgi:hypothetical protein
LKFLGGRSVRRPAWTALLAGGLVLAPPCAPPSAATPLSKPEVIKLVRRNVQEVRLLAVVRELGIDFRVSGDTAEELRAAGASATLIAALRRLSPDDGGVPASPRSGSATATSAAEAPAPASPIVAPSVPPPAPAPEPPTVMPPAPPPAPPTVTAPVVAPAPPPAPPVTPPPAPTPPTAPVAAPAPPPVPATPPAAVPPPAPAPPPVSRGSEPAPTLAAAQPGPEPPSSPALPQKTRDIISALVPGPPPPPPPPLALAAPVPPPEPVPRPAPAAAEPAAGAPAPLPPIPPLPQAPAPPTAAEAAARWEQVRPLLEQAQTLAGEGDVRGAQKLVAKAMELDPGEPRVWKTFKGIEQDLLVRAETFLAEGQLPRALREFQFIITTNPESALGYNGMGQALLQLRNYDEAVAAFEKALALEPGNARYREALTRARGLQRAHRTFEQRGRENLKEMIEDQPGRKKGP